VVRAQCDLLETRCRRVEDLVVALLDRSRLRLDGLTVRLSDRPLRETVQRHGTALDREEQRLLAATAKRLEAAHQRVERCWSLCESLGPTKVLERGYALVRALPRGPVVMTAAAAAKQPGLLLSFADGDVTVSTAAPGARRRRPGEPAEAASQPSLL
jgi:exodeoxyribonuclease VII large subunit